MESLEILTFKVPEVNNNIKSHNEAPLQKQLKKILTIPSVDMDSHTLLVVYTMLQPFWKRVWQFLIRLNIHLLYDPHISLLIVYPKQWKLMFIQRSVHECL